MNISDLMPGKRYRHKPSGKIVTVGSVHRYSPPSYDKIICSHYVEESGANCASHFEEFDEVKEKARELRQIYKKAFANCTSGTYGVCADAGWEAVARHVWSAP